ncbi:2' O-ribose methyltransferase [Coemansia erecta]|uniref:rRNA methyltransferase 2, mitochondrial n=1 Tax=Coemansia asiatica TaxID=1052880 RepID=A0A9W7XQ52_9FUNG|nr:2' O-ribose methyltransferase [Coemansia asiatica]KAJ2853469.1 2' O-ribose methyltransferase [Coemansia erecta]KAJ2880808.1 2' O-ribose methyltransferase [Coemansia asiatica]
MSLRLSFKQTFRYIRSAGNLWLRSYSGKKGHGSSHRYIERQQRDPFVKQAKNEQFRARSSFKLIEMLDKYKLLPKSPSTCIVDCGASPGGWSQVISRRLFSDQTATPLPRIIAVDLLPMRAVPGVHFIQGDFLDDAIKTQVANALGQRRVGLLLSDMAPAFTGHHSTDAARTMNLCEDVLAFSDEFLAFGGNLVMKFFMGGGEAELKRALKMCFDSVVVEKPLASRKQSSEQYFVCIGKNKHMPSSSTP